MSTPRLAVAAGRSQLNGMSLPWPTQDAHPDLQGWDCSISSLSLYTCISLTVGCSCPVNISLQRNHLSSDESSEFIAESDALSAPLQRAYLHSLIASVLTYLPTAILVWLNRSVAEQVDSDSDVELYTVPGLTLSHSMAFSYNIHFLVSF